jgi:hypothetical protein
VTAPAANQVSGTVVRAYVEALERFGLRTEVRARVSAEAGALMDRIPNAIQWVNAAHVDEMSQHVLTVFGRDRLRAFAYDIASKTTGLALSPIIKTSLLFGDRTPATLLAHFAPAARIMLRGFDLRYDVVSPTSGVVTVSFEEPAAPARLYGWDGVLKYVVEFCDVDTVIAPGVIQPDQRSCTFALSWTVRPTKA